MNAQTRLRIFLARQKSVPYCMRCLVDTGMFANDYGAMAALARSSVLEFPTAVALSISHCAFCLTMRFCIVFPGAKLDAAENASTAKNPVKITVTDVEAHFWEVLDVATNGEEVEIERSGEASIYLTLNEAGDAWKLSKNRRQPET